jgi:uncharacterized lipoprotein YbaY
MEEMKPMPIVAPLFIQNGTTYSEITIVSEFSKNLDVEVILSSLSGTELARKKVSMDSHSQKKLKVADVLADAHVYQDGIYGSISLEADRPAPFAAQLSIVDKSGPQPVDVEEEFVMLMGVKPANYRAVTGNLSDAPVVSIRSLSAIKQTVSIGCVTEDGSNGSANLPIEPNQTLLVQACHGPAGQLVRLDKGLFEKSSDVKRNSKHAAGIVVSSSAPAEELAVFGIGLHEDAKKGLSAIPFSDVNTLRSSTAIYTGVPIGESAVFGTQSFKLRAAFANFGNAPRTANILLSGGDGADSTQKTVATVSIPPNSASTADLAGILPDGVAARSLVIQADGSPGEILTEVQAVSASNSAPMAFALPWKDREQFENGGRHPWSVDRSVSSTLLLFNPDPVLKNTSIRVTIYSGKSIWTKQYSLPPLATLAVSLKDIVYKQEPDEKGRKLPPDATGGMLTWSALAKPRIFGKLLQADAIAGISRVRTYACGSINSACGVSVQDPYPNPFLVGQQTYVSGFPLGCTGDSPCSCNDACGSGSGGGSMSWESEDPGIASVVGSGGSGTYQGNSAGQTWADASVVDNNGCGGSGSASMTVYGFSQNDIAGLFSAWTDNGDGTVTVTTTGEFGALQGLYQCGCTNPPPPDVSGDSIIRGGVYDPQAIQQLDRAVKTILYSLVAWFLGIKGQPYYKSPTGNYPGHDPNNPNAPGFASDGEGDFVRNNPDGSTEKLHPDLDSSKGPHWDYNYYPPSNQPGAYGGRIYDDPESMSGIYVPNKP